MLLSSTDALLINDNVRYRDTLTYDVANNVIKLDGYQQINGNWTHVYYLDYEYDQDGNLTTRKNYNSFGGSTFKLGGIYKYFYNSNNQLESWELYFNETDLIEVGTVTYNAEGKKLEELGTMGVSNQNLFANNLRMFPNPATDQFKISTDKNIITAIDIADTTGKVILKETNLNKKEANLNIANLQSGFYYIRSTTTKGINTQKLVVQ